MNFQSTQQLYGVDPHVLAEMPYKEALLLMNKGLWKRKRELADALFQATTGDEASAIQNEFRKVLKAISLTDLRLEEIK